MPLNQTPKLDLYQTQLKSLIQYTKKTTITSSSSNNSVVKILRNETKKKMERRKEADHREEKKIIEKKKYLKCNLSKNTRATTRDETRI